MRLDNLIGPMDIRNSTCTLVHFVCFCCIASGPPWGSSSLSDKPTETQRGPKRHKEAQRALERHRDAQRGSEGPGEAQRGLCCVHMCVERSREAEHGKNKPVERLSVCGFEVDFCLERYVCMYVCMHAVACSPRGLPLKFHMYLQKSGGSLQPSA